MRIYDGLEIILKVTKNAKNVYMNTLWWKWWWWMSLLLCPLSSVFFYFDVSPHLSPLNGLERSEMRPWKFKHWCMMVMKEVKMLHGGLLSTVYVSDGLESSQFCSYTHDASWNESIHHVGPKWSWKKSSYGWWFSLWPWPWPVTVVCRVPMVTFQPRGFESPHESPWSTSWG